MEHAKKMMLVDASFVRPTLKEKVFVGLDANINTILGSDVSDDMKAVQYMHALNRYRTLNSSDQPSADAKQKATNDRVESNLLDSVSADDRYKAKQLMSYIKRNKDMKLDEEGQLEYQQQPLNKSDIVELVTNILRKETGAETQPIGWEEFAEGLQAANAP